MIKLMCFTGAVLGVSLVGLGFFEIMRRTIDMVAYLVSVAQ